jgi:hypothetical protein
MEKGAKTMKAPPLQMVFPKTLTHRILPNGATIPVWYKVEIDMHELHAMARRADGNKSGKAKDGPLRVTVTTGIERA